MRAKVTQKFVVEAKIQDKDIPHASRTVFGMRRVLRQ
jgi:hypothetical protein